MGPHSRRGVEKTKPNHKRRAELPHGYFPLSVEADCLSSLAFERGVRKLPWVPARLYRFLRGVELAMDIAVCKVNTKYGEMWADRVTGSLYHVGSGEGLSGGRIELEQRFSYPLG